MQFAPSPWIRRLAKPVLVGLLVLVAMGLGPDLYAAWWLDLTRADRRWLTIGFLNATLIGYGLILLGSALAGTWAVVRLWRRRDRSFLSRWAPRILLASVTCSLCMVAAEFAAWGVHRWQTRVPERNLSATVIRPEDTLSPAAQDLRDPERDLVLLVLGESSAQGQPYEAWTSIGHMVAWQMEQAQPGRKVRLVMTATGGANLTEVVRVMNEQTVRPDLVLLYAGHNEFQARWGWTHVVDYYPDDSTQQVRSHLIERVGDWTPLCRMVRDAFDRQMIDYDPPPGERREMVDRPVCDSATRRRIGLQFEDQLEEVARWCGARSALPIFIVPAGNDAAFDPDRSLLNPGTRLNERRAFEADFRKVRQLAETDPASAIPGYQRLIVRQPRFAEAHYRLAQLLERSGRTDEARRQYIQARDLDGLPMRCPSDFQDAYRRVASRHDLVLVDANEVLQRISPTGLLDDNVFHDAQHTTFRGYLALAQQVLDRLASRGVFAMKPSALGKINPEVCAAYFGLGPSQWALVCDRSARIWDRLAHLRYDEDERRMRADHYLKAARRIREGVPASEVGVPGLGVFPPGFR